jgi:hypothetical protein
MKTRNIHVDDITGVECGEYQAAIDVSVKGVETAHESK